MAKNFTKLFALKEFGSLPENTNFGIKVSVIKSLLKAHDVNFLEGSNRIMPNLKIGKLANGGTVFLSCWMTTRQYDLMKQKKIMFEDVGIR